MGLGHLTEDVAYYSAPGSTSLNNTIFNATFDAAASGNWDGFAFNATSFGPAAPNSQSGAGDAAITIDNVKVTGQ